MAAKAKIAVSLAPEVLELVDRHAAGRSRSQCIEQELLRALRAREWERLSAQMAPDDLEEQLAWAEASLTAVDAQLAGQERKTRPRASQKRRRR